MVLFSTSKSELHAHLYRQYYECIIWHFGSSFLRLALKGTPILAVVKMFHLTMLLLHNPRFILSFVVDLETINKPLILVDV